MRTIKVVKYEGNNRLGQDVATGDHYVSHRTMGGKWSKWVLAALTIGGKR